MRPTAATLSKIICLIILFALVVMHASGCANPLLASSMPWEKAPFESGYVAIWEGTTEHEGRQVRTFGYLPVPSMFLSGRDDDCSEQFAELYAKWIEPGLWRVYRGQEFDPSAGQE